MPRIAWLRLARLLVCAAWPGAAAAQEIEPRAFSNTPVGVNFLAGGYAFTRGGLSTDPDLPLTDPRLRTSSAVFGYARALDVFGLSAKFDAALPLTWLNGTANRAGVPVERAVDGFGDARLRLSVNFFGAPAVTLSEFPAYRQDLILGGSFQVSVPTGQYDPTRLINLGTNRWFFRPGLGASKALGRLILELVGEATFFTENADFFGGHRRTQAPVFALQGHAIYSFSRGIWGSLDATGFTGGRSTVDGVANDDRQQNWRIGATLAVPLDARFSVKLYASHGVFARTGNNYDLVGVALQYRWGGGLP
jgi:hypothetical protein